MSRFEAAILLTWVLPTSLTLAAGDSDVQLGQAFPTDLGAGLSRTVGRKPADADGGARVFSSEREAAVGFVDMARRLPDQQPEYCAYIIRTPDGRFGLGKVRQGDMNRCPADRPKPANVVASVHTHPIRFGGSDVSAPGQVFSEGAYEGDIAFAENMQFAEYLGAPAGHVLRYVPGNTFCKGSSFIMYRFEVVRDLRPSVIGRLPVNPGQYKQLLDLQGTKLPKPPYCKDAPATN